MTKPTGVAKLILVKQCLRRLRRVYIGVTGVGVVLSALLASYLLNGGELEGAAIAFAMLGPGVLLIGLALLLPRLRVESSEVVRVLTESPGDIVHVGLKRTESTIAGMSASSYDWVVLRLNDGAQLELWVKQHELQPLLAEIRAQAPSAQYDRRVSVQRIDVRL